MLEWLEWREREIKRRCDGGRRGAAGIQTSWGWRGRHGPDKKGRAWGS